jgi:hypothetical protein
MTVRAKKSTSPSSSTKGTKGVKLRKMKAFQPRTKRARTVRLSKQQLIDLEHKISADIGSFLVLLEQGNAEQVTSASQKARSDFLKLGPDMKKLATQMGGAFPKHVSDFLDSIDNILHTGVNWLDEGKIKDCYCATQRLEEALKTRTRDIP